MDFIVVGGVAAVLQGAPLATFDLDIVHSRDAPNLERIIAALDDLEARYRIQPTLAPQASHLASLGHQLLITRYGPLDLLGAIGHEHEYIELRGQSLELSVAGELVIRVLDLPWLIKTKEETAGEKDLAVLPILRRTLAERQRR